MIVYKAPQSLTRSYIYLSRVEGVCVDSVRGWIMFAYSRNFLQITGKIIFDITLTQYRRIIIGIMGVGLRNK
ncbi:hypothetical protein HvAV-3i_gp007 [Heliothis virescens ascovirus 3i]|nr:hypothetical protein HvAV-3i_gp007 [Heliothis virescens ascovirus 3i]